MSILFLELKAIPSLLFAKESQLIERGNLLIESGAEINARSWNGRLILTTLLKEGRFLAAKFLVEKGAKIDLEDLKLKSKCGKELELILKASNYKHLRALVEKPSYSVLHEMLLKERWVKPKIGLKHIRWTLSQKFIRRAIPCFINYLQVII